MLLKYSANYIWFTEFYNNIMCLLAISNLSKTCLTEISITNNKHIKRLRQLQINFYREG